MKKQPQITEQTRKNLMDSFWKLYKNNTKITIREICNIANYDRTTFYRYFTDIEDIRNQLEDEIIYSIKDSINKSLNSDENHHINNSIFQIRFDKFCKFNDTYGEYIISLLNNESTSFYNKFKKLLKYDCYDYFNINTTDNEKNELIFEFVFSNLINSYTYWYEHKKSLDIKSFVEFANNVIASGVNIILKYDYDSLENK